MVTVAVSGPSSNASSVGVSVTVAVAEPIGIVTWPLLPLRL